MGMSDRSDRSGRSDLAGADATFQIPLLFPAAFDFLPLSVPDLPHATNGLPDRAPFESQKVESVRVRWSRT